MAVNGRVLLSQVSSAVRYDPLKGLSGDCQTILNRHHIRLRRRHLLRRQIQVALTGRNLTGQNLDPHGLPLFPGHLLEFVRLAVFGHALTLA